MTVIDLFRRECLAIDIGQGLGGPDVSATLEPFRFERGLPQRIYCDNGTEFVSARCLNAYWFSSLEDAQQKIDAFR